MTLDPYLTSLTEINPKFIKDLNIRNETVKLPEENIKKRALPDTCLGNDFLDMTPKAWSTKTKINKWDYIKLKALGSRRNNQQNEKETYRMEENICKSYIC